MFLCRKKNEGDVWYRNEPQLIHLSAFVLGGSHLAYSHKMRKMVHKSVRREAWAVFWAAGRGADWSGQAGLEPSVCSDVRDMRYAALVTGDLASLIFNTLWDRYPALTVRHTHFVHVPLFPPKLCKSCSQPGLNLKKQSWLSTFRKVPVSSVCRQAGI